MSKQTQVAFITGGNRGIGLETARQLAQKGVRVVIGSRDETKGADAVRRLSQEGLEAQALRFDVSRAEDHAAARQYFEEKFGRLDILVNNAGVMIERGPGGKPFPVSALPASQLRETFEANFFAPVALTQVLLPLLRKSEGGRIVNLSSILGSLTLHADPASPIRDSKQLAYDASKAALNLFTIHLAHELRDTKIKVNSAHPGWVKTDMGGAEAPMELADGAKTSVQLALLPADGPTGGYFHMGERLPW